MKIEWVPLVVESIVKVVTHGSYGEIAIEAFVVAVCVKESVGVDDTTPTGGSIHAAVEVPQNCSIDCDVLVDNPHHNLDWEKTCFTPLACPP